MATARQLPADVYPETLSRLPPLKRETLNEAQQKAYDAVTAPRSGRLNLAGIKGPGGVILRDSPGAVWRRRVTSLQRVDRQLRAGRDPALHRGTGIARSPIAGIMEGGCRPPVGRGVAVTPIRPVLDPAAPHRVNFARLGRSRLDWRLLCPGPMVDEPALGLDRIRRCAAPRLDGVTSRVADSGNDRALRRRGGPDARES